MQQLSPFEQLVLQDSDHAKFEAVFEDIDADGSMTLSWEEFAWHFGVDPTRLKPPDGNQTVIAAAGHIPFTQCSTNVMDGHDLEISMTRARQSFYLFDMPSTGDHDGKDQHRSVHGKGFLNRTEIEAAIRWIGLPNTSVDGLTTWGPVHPSEQACESIAESLENNGGATESRFVAAMVPAPPCRVVRYDDLVDAFREFDEDRDGYLTDEQFVGMLTQYGEPLTTDEADQALKYGGIKTEKGIDYRRYADHILQRPLNITH